MLQERRMTPSELLKAAIKALRNDAASNEVEAESKVKKGHPLDVSGGDSATHKGMADIQNETAQNLEDELQKYRIRMAKQLIPALSKASNEDVIKHIDSEDDF